MREIKIFSGGANPQLAQEICEHLHLQLGKIHLSQFPDTENYCRIEENVRGRDVFLVQPTCPPVNDHLLELLIMIDSCRRASAAQVTAVMPYFGYARQDRKDEGRVPITAKLVANMITRAGADRVLTMDLHAAQIQGFFDVPVDHLYAAPVLDDYFEKLMREKQLSPEDVVVVSPDEGSIKRALVHARRLHPEDNNSLDLAIIDKRRSSATETQQENIIGGPVEGRVAFMIDDMISTAGSIVGAAEALHKANAKEIYVAATHGLLCGQAISRLEKAPVTEVIVTNSIPLKPEQQIPCVRSLSVASLLGEAIKRIHQAQSISDLFRDKNGNETGLL